MKRFYMAFAALIAGGMITVGGNAVSAQQLNKQVKRTKMTMVQKRTSPAIERMPQTEEGYSWNYESLEWVKSTVSKMKYDGALLTEKVSDVYNAGDLMFSIRETYNYNDENREIEKISEGSYDEGASWQKEERFVTEYDVIRKDLPILNEKYTWDMDLDEWYFDEEFEDGFYLEIERDDKNRVTKSTRWLNKNKPIALTKQEFGYTNTLEDLENHATSMKWYALNDYYELQPAYIYENMSWAESDGQYLNISPNVYYAFDADANNKLLEYNLYNANADGTKGDLEAAYSSVYDETGRLSYIEINFSDGTKYQCLYNYDKDANGSYEFNDIISGDFNENGQIDTPDECIMSTTYVTCNEYGDIIKEEMFEVDADMNKTLNEGYGYDMLYNEEGLLQELVLTYYTTMIEGGSWENLSKFIYSDYTDGTATGINAAEKGNANVILRNNTLYFDNARGAHYIVSDLNGKTYAHGVVTGDKVSVNNMPEGMYIVKIAGKNCNNAVKLIKK